MPKFISKVNAVDSKIQIRSIFYFKLSSMALPSVSKRVVVRVGQGIANKKVRLLITLMPD